jgi:hypothetical protein
MPGLVPGSHISRTVRKQHAQNSSHITPLIRLDAQNAVRLSPFKDRPLKSGPDLQIGVMQPAREGSPPPGLRLPQIKLSRKYNQVARGRIRKFESDMPSQPVWSLDGILAARLTSLRACCQRSCKDRHVAGAVAVEVFDASPGLFAILGEIDLDLVGVEGLNSSDAHPLGRTKGGRRLPRSFVVS